MVLLVNELVPVVLGLMVCVVASALAVVGVFIAAYWVRCLLKLMVAE